MQWILAEWVAAQAPPPPPPPAQSPAEGSSAAEPSAGSGGSGDTAVPAAPSDTGQDAQAAAAPDASQASSSDSSGCAAAIAYLQANAAPGFSFECPGGSEGHEAMTCLNVPGVCPGTAVIAISDPCPAAYMNEASNSWVVSGQSDAAIDPYGSC